MKQQGLILIVLLSFACFAAASDEYCPFNPSGECPGFKSDTAQKSGDTFFYCDTGASMFGSDTCRYLGVIDGRYPVSTGVCPNGYPILFFSTGTVDDLSVDVAYVNCLDYGCTEVSEPKLLPGFNGLYAVDTAIVSINDVETLVVAGVTDQISAEQLGDQQGSTWWSVQYPQYEVVLAFSTDDMCTNFTVNQPDLNEAYVLNPRISSKLVQITATSNPSFPYGITYVTVSPTLSNYNEIIDNNQLGYSGPTPGPTPGPPARKAGKKAQQAASADEAEKADKPDSDKANSVFGAQESLQRNAHFQNMLSCWGYCDIYYGTSVWIPSSRYMSQFSSDLPWTNNFPSLNQQSDFYDLPAGSAYENFYRTLPDSPFSYNTFLPRPLLLHNKKGDFFFGLQAVQRMPASDIRGLNECGNIEDPESADYREADSSLETSSPYSRFARKVASLTQNLFGGTTNVRFYRCPSATTTEQEAPGFCEGLFEEEEAPITDPIPHPNAALQYSGRSTIHGYKLRDASEEEESETAGENIEDTQEENFDYNNPGDDFWTEAANSYSDNTPLCTESYPTSVLKMVEHQDDDMKHSPGTQRTLGGTRPTRVLGGSRATRSSPRSLTVGLAGNGLPALVGISTVSTGEPSAAGWSLVLSVCLTESCDQQVFRYLMDSSALHDNWGIMDDPFAAVNQILNHPDGSWSIVLFVQPQGEQIDRHTDLPRGEGSTGKPLIINCLDETCSSAYVSLLAPNRLQSTLPSDQTFLTMPSYPTITNDVHSFTYVGEANEYLLVTVRDIPMGPYQYANTNPSGTPYYTPSAVRLWKTNRYASPTGYPCTAESVGTMETIDGSLFICTRLNTGHDLTMGDISGWVRYYEWVDVGHSFASRLWANLPAGRSPLELSPWNNPASEAPLFAPLTSGLSRAANKQTASKATTAAASSGLIAGQPLACCDQQVWTPAPGQHADIALETPVFAGAVKIYFSSLDVPSMLPLAGFYVSLIDANGASTPVLKGFPTLIHGGEFYCQVLVIPIKSTGKATPTSSLRVGLSFLQTTQDSCESNSQPCKIAIAGVEVVAAPASFSSVAPFFAPFPADLAPADIKSGSWPCVVPQ